MMGDVAIIGMACTFPKAPNLRTFWENILGKVDAIGDPPADWGAEDVYDPGSSANDRVYCKRGGYIGELARFNPLDYGVMPRAVDGGEPEHFLALHVAHEALADAGYLDRPFNREATEVIMGRGTYVNRGYITVFQHAIAVDQTIRLLGTLHPEYSPEDLDALKRKLKASLPPFNAETAPSLAHSVMCGRIANRLDLMGSAYTVDAACASSLLAVEQGITDLRSRKCDLVLAGGIQISTTFPIALVFCQLGALSRRGEIRPFHPDADGTLLGEGVGIVVLKRREDAERDSDRIYAVLKGVGIASDGRALGVLAPRVEGEELAMRRAYERAGIAPHTIGLLEAHGTGTPVGDATEIEALSRVFGKRDGRLPWCAMGSIKSMIGHSIPAAGVAGLIKAALALYHKVLPPTLHADSGHPKLASTPFYLNGETRPWIHAGPGPRRAAVSAFGFGGINAHAILEEHDASRHPVNLHRRRDSEVFILAGTSRDDLRAMGEQLRSFLKRDSLVAPDTLAFTLNSSLPDGATSRLAIVAESLPDLDRKLAHALERLADPGCRRIKEISGIYFFEELLGLGGKLAFLFPGEGAQYPNMLADLCIHFPEARAWFDLMDRAFLDHPRGYLPSQVIFPLPGVAVMEENRTPPRLWQMDSAIEAVFTANQALHAVLTRLGVRTHGVVGHSTGEYSALLVAGAVEVEDESQLVRYVLDGNGVTERALRAGRVPEGALLAVGPADARLLQELSARADASLYLAMDNCPHQIVLAGTEEAVARVQRDLSARGAICQRLPFSRAYHTPLFAPVCAELAEFFRQMRFVSPKVRIYSCATVAPFPDDPEEARQVAVAQWTRPVRFRETVEAMYADGVRLFVEVGPRGNLTAFVDDILRGRPYLAVAANLPRRSGITQLNHLLGLLAAHGVPLALEPLYARRGSERLAPEALWDASHPPPAPDRSMRLSLALPALRIEGAPAFSPPRSAIHAGVGTGPTVAPVLGNGASAVEAEMKPASRPSILPAPARRMIRRNGPNPVDGVMTEYLRTMEGFLDTQERVLLASLGGRPLGQQFLPDRTPATHPAVSEPGMPPPATVPPPPPLPFIGRVKCQVADQEVVVCRTLDMGEDLFLRDHTLGPRISETDPDLTPLPILPLALSLEMMAEVASLLVPRVRVSGFRAVRSFRWVSLASPRVTVRIEAKRRAGVNVEVAVEIREVAEGSAENADGPILVAGIVCLGELPPPPSTSLFQVREARLGAWGPDRLYASGERHGMFHGPAFQGVVSMDRVGEDGAEATLRALPVSGLFHSQPEPAFVIDPLFLDAAGQVVGFWAADWLARAFVIFPVGFEAVHFYGPWPRRPARATCQVRISKVEESLIRAELDIIDPEGRLLFRVIGWEVKRFELPDRFYNFRLNPKMELASVPWDALLKRCPTPDGLRCCRLEFPPGFLEADAGIWREGLAGLVLSRREREAWRALSGTDRRRNEWLLGRVAAKDAVRLLLRDRFGLTMYPADIEIVADEHGQPRVEGEWTGLVAQVPLVSIAHSGGVAVAIASEGDDGEGVGIDIEHMGRTRPGFEGVAFTPAEQDLLASMRIADGDEWSLRLWCAKEAVAKALGRGMMGKPRDFVVCDIDQDTGRMTLTLSGEMAETFPDLWDCGLTAYTSRVGELVVAMARHQGNQH